MMKKLIGLCLCGLFLYFFLPTTTYLNVLLLMVAEPVNTFKLPEINLNQTANMKLAFLGVPSEYVNRSQFALELPKSVRQFAYPNTMTWNLNFSLIFYPFPKNVSDSLRNSAFYSEGIAYFNITLLTLLDVLLSQIQDLAIPKCGYLLVFMWVPNATDHSWFYVPERPDLLLNRTDYLNGSPYRSWIFPSGFGGLKRAVYFDISETMEQAPTELLVRRTVLNFIENSLVDVFTNLCGVQDSRLIAADTQIYRDYKVKVLWLNGTGQQFSLKPIQEEFENLMPWTSWTVEMETKPADNTLNNLMEGRTEQLYSPHYYSFLLSNGSSFAIEARRRLDWQGYEIDPVNVYFFNHVKDYFDLADLEDKSIIPVVFLQLDRDTEFGGPFGAGPGAACWFSHNVIIVGFQAGIATAMGESGPLLLLDVLMHEIGHWVSLSHHPLLGRVDAPEIICPMGSLNGKFCAFCRDARARMSFISYYKAIVELQLNNQTKREISEAELNDALQLFYNWEYSKAVETIASIYFNALIPAPYIPILLMLIGVVVVIIISVGLFYKKKKGVSEAPNTNT